MRIRIKKRTPKHEDCKLLRPWLDGELAQKRRVSERFRKHLKICERCREASIREANTRVIDPLLTNLANKAGIPIEKLNQKIVEALKKKSK